MSLLGKLSYIGNKKVFKELISMDKHKILLRCEDIADKELQEQHEVKESHDTVCPKCRARKEHIVDKIKNTFSSGSINGEVRFGYGQVKSNITVQTTEVNHCNKCGHEWKKYNVRQVTSDEVMKIALKYLADIIEDDNHMNHEWKRDTVKVFDGAYIESIIDLYRDFNKYVQKIPSRKQLKRHFVSVYNSEVK